VDAIREYVFGNDLFAWGNGDSEVSAPYWTEMLAEAAGISYATAIQTGMLTSHDDLPPNPHLWINGVDASWEPESGQSFAEAGITQITLSAVNFVQDQSPDSPYWHEPATSPLAAALQIIDWAQARAPGAAINIYETWPELDSYPPSPQDFAAWTDLMTGEWHAWWVDLTEMIQQARPDLDVRLISVGTQVADMLDTPELGLSALSAEDLFLDSEGHATPSLSFLAGLLHFTTLTGNQPPQNIEIPNSIHPDIAQNYSQIIQWIGEHAAGATDEVAQNNLAALTAEAEVDVEVERTAPESDAREQVAEPQGTVVLSGAQDNYTLRIADDSIVIEDRRSDGDGQRVLSADERLDFAENLPVFGEAGLDLDLFDGMAQLEGDAMAALTELYIAYFNRAPDAVGLYFWGNQLADGMSMREIAGYFFDQPEPRELYGEEINLARFVSAVYNNVFGRAPDADGFRFWLSALENDDAITPATFIMDILAGAKAATGSVADAEYLASKVALGLHFGIARGMSDVAEARTVMAQFDGSEDSLAEGLAQSDAFYADALASTDGDFLIQLVGYADDGVLF
jgi:hypothetical protein